MAIQSQPSRISEPFAGSGTKNVIPATNATPSASQAASWASGFPPECSQPISAGGCPVPRDDVNGVLNWLSQGFAYQQDGGIWGWSALADYDVQRVVRGSDGLLYWSVQQSGPGVAAGAQDPTADNGTYWSAPEIPTAGASANQNTAATLQWVKDWYTQLALPSDLYIDATNGDDGNDALSSSTPVKTFSALIAIISSTDRIKPQEITVHVASGTYSDSPVGVPGVVIIYNFENGSSLSSNISASHNETIKLTGNLTTSAGLLAGVYGEILLGNNSDSLTLTFSNKSGGTCIQANSGSISRDFNAPSVAIKFSGTCTPSVVVSIAYGGISRWQSAGGTTTTWSVNSGSSLTGKRYNVVACSVLSNVGGANVIPGSTAGTADSTSYFS